MATNAHRRMQRVSTTLLLLIGVMPVAIVIFGVHRFTSTPKRPEYACGPASRVTTNVASFDAQPHPQEGEAGGGCEQPGSWACVDSHMQRLQEVLLESVGGEKGEIIGNIAFHPLQVNYYHRASKRPGVKTICEVGFGPGQSSIIYLASNPGATVFNFDLYPFLGESPELLHIEYVERQPMFQPKALEYINAMFPGRFHAIKGNRNVSVPEFAKAHPDIKCDLISIDGSHIPSQPFYDIYHFHALAHEKSILVLDDMQDLYGDLERAANGGIVELVECLKGEKYVDERYAPWPLYPPGKQFCESRYLKTDVPTAVAYTGESGSLEMARKGADTLEQPKIEPEPEPGYNLLKTGAEEDPELGGPAPHVLPGNCAKTRINQKLLDELYYNEYRKMRFQAGDKRHLPKLGIVVSIAKNMLCQYQEELSAALCYAAYHNIPLYVEPFQLAPDRHYFYSRQLHLKKYLPYHQWVVHLDADVMFMNYSKSILDFLPDHHDVMFAFREDTGEVFNAAYFIKNSEYGYKFLDSWISQSDSGRQLGNYDNGDLLEVLIGEIAPQMTGKCHGYRRAGDYPGFAMCFLQALNGRDMHGRGHQIKIPNFEDSFVRSFEPSWEGHQYYTVPFQGDFLGHGKMHAAVMNKNYSLCVDPEKLVLSVRGDRNERMRRLKDTKEYQRYFRDMDLGNF